MSDRFHIVITRLPIAQVLPAVFGEANLGRSIGVYKATSRDFQDCAVGEHQGFTVIANSTLVSSLAASPIFGLPAVDERLAELSNDADVLAVASQTNVELRSFVFYREGRCRVRFSTINGQVDPSIVDDSVTLPDWAMDPERTSVAVVLDAFGFDRSAWIGSAAQLHLLLVT